MAHFLSDVVLDAGLKEIANNCDKMYVCAGMPATYAEASGVRKLAEATLVPGVGAGDYAISDRSGGGRKLVVAEQSNLSVAANGTATHVAFCDSTGDGALHGAVALSASLTVGSGETVSIPETVLNFTDPA